MMEGKLPKGWEVVNISDVSEIVSGIGFPKDLQGKTKGKFPFYKVGDISRAVKSGRKFLENAESYIDKDEKKFLKAKEIPKNTIVFAKIGEALKLNRRGILSTPSFIDNNVMGLIPNRNIENLFLYYFLLTEDLGKYSSGNTVPSIRKSSVAEIQIPLPPLPEQKRIVAKLDALFGHQDTLKEKLNRIPELLKNFRQQVLTQAVTGELTRGWREGKGLGEWEYEKAENCCLKVQSGGTPKSDGFAESGIPFLKVYNIVNNKIDFEYKPQFVTPEVHGKGIKKSILLPGDVLMNIVGPPLNKIAIVSDDYEEWNLNQAITLFRPKEHILNRFLYYFFCEGSSVRSVHNETRGVVGQVNISLSQCRNFEIPIPRLEEQKEIVSRIDALFDLADKIESQYQSLKIKIDQLPQAILAKAFRGELVGQEVKEYVREAREVMMAAEGMEDYKNK